MVALASMELEAIAASAHLNTQGRPVKMKLKVTFSIGLIELLVHSEIACINSKNLESYTYLTILVLSFHPTYFCTILRKLFGETCQNEVEGNIFDWVNRAYSAK